MGQVCCLNNPGNAASCVGNCNATQLCDPNAANGGGCPQGNACQAGGINGLPNTYGSCQ